MSRRPGLRITDHALLRYLERAQGVDVESVRRKIRRKVQRGHEAGAVGVLVDGVRFVLRGDSVVTVLDSQALLRDPPEPRE